MADSRQYRKKYYLSSIITLVLLVVVLGLLSKTADETSGLKLDFTRDGLYTISDATKEIFGALKDKVTITYYCSEELPSFLTTIVRDTEDQFEELRKISDGKLRYSIVNPDDLADRAAAKATDEYMELYNAGELKDLQEPEPAMDIQAMMAGRQRPSAEDIRGNREVQAKERAARDKKKTKEEAYEEILLAEFKQKEIQSMAEEGVNPYIVPDRTANSVKQLRVYSSIKISYLDRPAEVIPFHSSLESLEYELAYRIVKVTQVRKPVVAFFDARKPPAPPMNPARPTPPPPSEYAAVINFLQELVDVRQISLKEGDSVDDLARSIKGDLDRKEKEEIGEEASGEVTLSDGDHARLVKCLVVAQPHALEDRQVYEINRAVSMGIPTIFLVSPYTTDISQQTGLSRGIPITILNSGLGELFKSWGVTLGDGMLGSNDSGAIMVPQRVLGNLTAMVPRPVSFVVSPSGDSIDSESSLTNRIPGLALPATPGMTLEQVDGLQSEKLVNSGKQSWSVKIDPLAGMNNPFNRGRPSGPTITGLRKDLIERHDPEGGEFIKPRTVAAFLKGKFKFKYQGESVPEWKKAPAGGGANPHQGIPGLPPGLLPGLPPVRDGDVLPDPSDPLADEAAPQEEAKEAEKPAPAVVPAPGSAQVEKAPEAPKVPGAPAVPAVPTDAGKIPEAAEKKAPAPRADVKVSEKGRALFLTSVDMLKNDFVTNAQQMPAYRYNAEFFRNCIENFALNDSLMKIRRKTLTDRKFEEGSAEKAGFIIFLNLAGVPILVGIFGLVRFLLRKSRSEAHERDFLQGR
ncbi:MAG: Gldg family protein [Planctomycetota bacterium]